MELANADLKRFYAHAATLEPSEAEVGRVISGLRVSRELDRTLGARTPFRAAGLVAIALATLSAAVLSAIAYPAARDALDAFFSGGAAPGNQIAESSLPAWLSGSGDSAHPASGSQRIVAEAGGERMYAFRDSKTGRACVVIGTDSDTCSDSSEWQRLFAGHALLKLASGVGPTADNGVAVFGLARANVARVELRDGSALVASARVTNGAWIVVAPQGTHDTLVALDSGGRVVESLDASGWTWRFCQNEAGCGPS